MKCNKCDIKIKCTHTVSDGDNKTFRVYKCPNCNECFTTLEILNDGSIITVNRNKVKVIIEKEDE